MTRPRHLALLALALLVAPSRARADEGPPPENIVCGDKKAGDACEVDGAAGACVPDSCVRLDYSNGVPPETVSYECLRCQPGAAAGAPAAPHAESAPPPAPAPASAPAPSEPAAKGGCAVDRPAGAMPLVVVLIGLLRRRRR